MMASQSCCVLTVGIIVCAVSVSVQAFECDGVEPVAGRAITLELVAEGLSNPVDITHAPGDMSRIFVVEQVGRIRIIDLSGDTLRPQPFLDIRNKVRSGGERGLLGLAFHPDYETNGMFFVYYTMTAGSTPGCPQHCTDNCSTDSIIARYRVGEDPDAADAASEEVLIRFPQPFSNHNGGQLQFGPNDGYLYISTGDGGSGGDPCGSGQDPLTFLGKLLRIDVDGESGYTIPADNPFSETDDSLDEIWALGLRNPWRFSFDPENADLYIADVGQNVWEEINYRPGSSTGGENYEWKRREADHDFSASTAYTIGDPTGPIYEYRHGGGVFRGCSITGGVVYRGCAMPDLQGTYFFTDYCNNWVGSFRVEDGTVADLENWTAQLNEGIAPDRVDDISAFGIDARGEIYICDLGSKLFRIVPSAPNAPPTARIVSDPAPAEVTLENGRAKITLDGSGSDDGDGGSQGLSYLWSRESGPDGYSIAEPQSDITAINLTVPGDYVFRLFVSDGQDSDEASIDVTVLEGDDPRFIRGDPNADSGVDISDGVTILLFLFVGGEAPGCLDAGDSDDNSVLELTDAVYLFNYLFLGGAIPPAPGVTDCGVDGTPDDALGCESFLPCEI